MLKLTLERLQDSLGTRVSLFLDPFNFTPEQAEALMRLKPSRIELYTERYADAFATPERESVTATYAAVAALAKSHGIGVNAGHDLNQKNLGFLLTQAPQIEEVSIGHALICEALEEGLQTTIGNYLKIVGEAPGR